jgi:hypothetical protein
MRRPTKSPMWFCARLKSSRVDDPLPPATLEEMPTKAEGGTSERANAAAPAPPIPHSRISKERTLDDPFPVQRYNPPSVETIDVCGSR